jgi:hypothetical protein
LQTLTANLKITSLSTTDKLIELAHKLFFSAKTDLTGGRDLSEVAQQWLLPSKLLEDLKLRVRSGTKGSFYGHIQGLFNFSETNTLIPVNNPLNSINGNAWAKLKEFSIEPLHELFTEINAFGGPQLIYRPIPWSINAKGYPSLTSKILKYKSLVDRSGIFITEESVLDQDLGEDSHSRYNHFFAWTSAAQVSNYDNISALKGQKSKLQREFPYLNQASIYRHGFKPMHTELNTLTYSVKDSKNGQADRQKLVEYNEVLFDYWASASNFESGTISIVGNNDVKLGKVLVFDNDSGDLSDKIFYVEGYTDSYTIEEDGKLYWTQQIQVTRGIEKARLIDNYTDKTLDAPNNKAKKGTFIED